MVEAGESDEGMRVRPDVGIDDDLDLDGAVIVALGCNDKGAWSSCREALEAALARFRCEGVDIVARSSWWASQAWPDPTDPPFLNGAVLVRTAHDPHALMAALGRIEDAFGRQRSLRNAPRTLDLDLIAYGRLSGDLATPDERREGRASGGDGVCRTGRPCCLGADAWKSPSCGREPSILWALACASPFCSAFWRFWF